MTFYEGIKFNMKIFNNDLFKGVIIALLLIIFIIFALEIGTRIIIRYNIVFNINIGGYVKYHPTRRTQLKANYIAENFTINSHGVLGPEFEIIKPTETLRILTIGDSTTFCPPNRNYSRVLEEKLRTLFPGNHIKVIVGAVPGYDSYTALDWYKEFLNKLNPDIAIVYLGWGDMGQYHPFGLRYKNESKSYRQRTWVGIAMEYLYFLRIPYFFIGRIESSLPVDTSPLTPQEKAVLDAFIPTHYKANLNSLIQDLKKKGAAVYLISPVGLITYHPTNDEIRRMHFPRNIKKKLAIYKAVYTKYMAALEEVSINNRAPIIDLREIIQSEEQRKIFQDTMHINIDGAEKFGNYIAEFIKPKVEEILTRYNKF